MNKIQALDAFWNSFTWPAFDESSVPDKTPTPYITYEVSDDNFGNKVMRSASLWYRSSSWEDITKKEQEIANSITRGGKMVPYDGGALLIQKGSPWAQRMSEPSDWMMRRIVLNVTYEFLD